MSKQEHGPTRPNLPFSVENILKEDFSRHQTPSPRKTCPVYLLPFDRRSVTVPLPVYCGLQYGHYNPFSLYPQPLSRIIERQNETANFFQPSTESSSATTPSTVYRSKTITSTNSNERRVATPEVFVNRDEIAKGDLVERKDLSKEKVTPRKTPTKGSADLQKDTTTKKKRIRSHFSQLQLQYLENVFSRQQYLSRDERTLLAGALEMTELQIRNWFQNKRYQKRHRELQAQQKTPSKQVPVKVLINSNVAPTSHAQPASPAASDVASDKEQHSKSNEYTEQEPQFHV